jgi:hypothetical protein
VRRRKMSTKNNEIGTKNGVAVDDKSKSGGDCGDRRGSANEIVREPNPATKASLAPIERSGSAADDKSKSFEVFDN